MSFRGITGNCSTIVFTGLDAAQTWIGRIIDFDGLTFTAESVEDNDLCSTFAQYIPGTVRDGELVTVTCVYDPSSNLPKAGDEGSVVITLPKQAAGAVLNQANLSGQCIIESVGIGTVSNNERITATLGIRWNGQNVAGDENDGPVYAPELVS